jgi:tetratricopeptide (TPR) repeat protein
MRPVLPLNKYPYKKDGKNSMSSDDENQGSVKQPISNWFIFLSFLFAAFVSYMPALPGPFVLDDIHNISANRHLKIEELSVESLVDAGIKGPSRNRPVPKITFALNYYLHGDDARGFRAVNVCLHALAAMGLFLFLKALMATPVMHRQKDKSFSLAFGASFLWLLHPAATQSVSYIVQRMAVMAALFMIFSLYFYLRARLGGSFKTRMLFYGLCILSGIMAILSKENAVVLLLLIPLCEWFFFQDLSQVWLKRALAIALPVGVLFVLLFVLYFEINPYKFVMGTYGFRDFTLYERLLTQFRVVVLYLGLIVFPLPASLNLFRDVAVSESLFAPFSTFLCLIFLLGLLAFAIVAARRMRFISFALLFFFITLAPESTIIGLELAFDHRTYLPSMLVVAALVWAAIKILPENKSRMALFLIVALLFLGGTSFQNRIWGERLAFFYEGIKRSPQSLRAWTGLSNALILEGYPKEALAAAQRGVELGPDDYFTWRMLGRALMNPEINRLEDAVYAYGKALDQFAADDNKLLALNELHLLLVQSKRFDEAEQILETALSMSSDRIWVLHNAGIHFLSAGQAKKAQELLMQAVLLDPAQAPPRESLGLAYMQTGQWEKAIMHFEEAGRLARPSAQLLCNIGMSYLELGDENRARESYLKVLDKKKAHHPRAYEGLGLVEAKTGNFRKAQSYYLKGLAIEPDSISLHSKMVDAAYLAGDFKMALAHLDALASIDKHGDTGLNPLRQADDLKQFLASVGKRIAHLKQSLEQNPDDVGLWVEMGDIQRKAGHWIEAQQAYEKALFLDPKSPDAANGFGLVAIGLEDYDLAARFFETVLEQDPKNIPALYNMASLFSRTNRNEEAFLWATKLFEAGFSGCSTFQEDNNFHNLRQSRYGREIIRQHCLMQGGSIRMTP